MAAAGEVHHNIDTFLYEAIAITNVVSVTWSKVGAQAVGLIDGSGAAAHYIVDPTAVAGVIVINSSAEADKLKLKVEAGSDVTYNTKNSVGVSKAVTITNIKTTDILGGQNSLASAGPHSIQFTADSVSSPAV